MEGSAFRVLRMERDEPFSPFGLVGSILRDGGAWCRFSTLSLQI